MQPTNSRRNSTRKQILDAAAQVFAEKGYDGASIDDIVERAGVARGTLYYNFASKEEIALSLAAAAMTELDARLRPQLDSPDLEALLLELMTVSCRWFLANPSIAPTVLTAPLRDPQRAAGPRGDRPSFRGLVRDI